MKKTRIEKERPAVSAEDFLLILKKDAAGDERRYYRYGHMDSYEPEEKEIVDIILNGGNEAKWSRAISRLALNQKKLVETFERSLPLDAANRLSDKHRPILEQILVGIIPLGRVNGHATRQDYLGRRLDKYLILINYGTRLACAALADALTMENLQGDFLKYQRSGRDNFEGAIRFISAPEVMNDYRLNLDGYPPEVQAGIQYQSAMLSAIMLEFIFLHELGHVISGDVDAHDLPLSFTPAGLQLAPAAESNFEREYKADRYAIETLCNWNRNPDSASANFAQVYYFFSWLEVIEKIMNITSSTHPSASGRKEAILKHTRSLGPAGALEGHVALVDKMVASWLGPSF